MLKRLADFGLKLKASKCKLLHTKLSYLAHVVSTLGVSPDPEKINALEWLQHPPKNGSNSRNFLAILGTIVHLCTNR